ncbi:MAG TPA: hypothetical protein VGZ52_10385 [Acidimicrobiales bacterium]|nr:hypothetical protein [Acidimicrobiales bacterium]
MHNDDALVPWYDGWRPSRHEADDHARQIGEAWRRHGAHKWMAYDGKPHAFPGELRGPLQHRYLSARIASRNAASDGHASPRSLWRAGG